MGIASDPAGLLRTITGSKPTPAGLAGCRTVGPPPPRRRRGRQDREKPKCSALDTCISVTIKAESAPPRRVVCPSGNESCHEHLARAFRPSPAASSPPMAVDDPRDRDSFLRGFAWRACFAVPSDLKHREQKTPLVKLRGLPERVQPKCGVINACTCVSSRAPTATVQRDGV